MAASLQPLPLSSRGLSPWLSPLLSKIPVILELGPTLLQWDLILSNYICKEPPISKLAHTVDFWVDMDLRGCVIQSSTTGQLLQVSLSFWSLYTM